MLCLTLTEAMATQVQPFNMTSVDGELALRYLFDEQTFYNAGEKGQQDTRPTFQEEFQIDTHSYVFHPNLLSVDLGGSILFDQSRLETQAGENSNSEALLGVNARLDFLNKKPYPVSLYYDKQNPSVSTGLGGRYLQENIRYGVDLSLLQPVSPVQININAFRQTMKGEGFDQFTDDTLEYVNLRLYRSYGAGEHVQLSHQINNRNSRSGSPNLAIQTRATSTASTYFDSKNVFGKARQIQLTNIISYNTQEEYPRREELRYNPYLNWQHSEQTRSFYRFNYMDSEEEGVSINQKNFTMGFGYTGQRYTGSMDIHGEKNDATGIDYQNMGANYQISHNRPIAIGILKLSYSGNFDYKDQASDTNLFVIYGEEHEMNGTTQVVLNREFIDTTTIEVWNTGRTQMYGASDYRILEVGSQVQIQRLADGNIVDGQLVLVDYSYQTGGSFAYNLVGNNFQISWKPSSFYDIYARYHDIQQNLQDGAPTVQLNSISSMTYGISADRPLLNGINLGGEAYYQAHDEDINPFIQTNIDAYMDLPLPQLTNLRLSTRRQMIDYENSEEDVDLTGYILHIRSRPWLRTELSYEFSYESDTGGTLERLQSIHRLRARWAYRQLSLFADAHYSAEEQGIVERERWAVKLNLLRKF